MGTGIFSMGRPRGGLVAGLVLAGVLAVASNARATEVGSSKNFGIGIVVGYPDIGLSINWFLSSLISVQIDPTIHFFDDNLRIGGRVDLLFWMPKLASFGFADLRWYWGPGANLGVGLGDKGGFGLGAELPVGIGFQFNSVPIDLNIEAVPVLHIIDDIKFGIGGALNARYYF